ncbi:MAG: guanylate cyclase [Rhodospirillum sp.]|nr:guanylate cyclase [Rhodospirillum sp.]
MERKLTTILAADVVGYAAHMERDERGTHERLSAGRKELFEPEIALHHGRVFKLMGDGLLAEFGSVVDAVECAVSLQRGLAERNAEVPENQRVQVRIGINLGEVIVEGDDRYGEGVNIAARLEQLADPGGICVSGKVAKEVEKKLAFGFEPMGAQQVKNIAEPVQAFRVRLDGTPARHMAPLPQKRALLWAVAAAAIVLVAGGAWFALRTPAPDPAPVVAAAPTPAAVLEPAVATSPPVADGKPSLVVLPFVNLSDDKEQGYLADGITEDLTTELARVPGLVVMSRNAAFTYKDKAVLPAQIAKELGVRYIIEGSTRRIGDDMRIHAQLIDAQSGGHIWAERFDGPWAEVFALQDKVVGQVAAALKLRLVSGRVETAGGTKNPAAYDAYLRALQLQYSATPEDWARSVEGFEQALALDPEFGRAAAQLAAMYSSAASVQSKLKGMGISAEEASAKRWESLERAARNPSSIYYQELVESLLYQQKSEEAIAAAQKAIALDPSDPEGYMEMSWALILNGRPQDGRDYLDAALGVDPKWTTWRYLMGGLAEFSMGRYAEAAAMLEKLEPERGVTSFWDFWGNYDGLRLLVSSYGHLGRNADADSIKEKLKPLIADVDDGGFTGLHVMSEFPFRNFDDAERLLEGLRKAGVPQLPNGVDPKSKDRLTGSEIKALIFGHSIEGRERETGNAYRRQTAMDGTADVTVGTLAFKLVTTIEGDFFCNWSPSGGRGCGAVFRNPGGTRAERNEYLFIRPWNSFEFSVVK